MSNKVLVWMLLIVSLGLLGWIGYFIFFSPYSLTLPFVQKAREGYLVATGQGLNLLKGKDYVYYPKEISIDSTAENGEFVYYFPSTFRDFDLAKRTIEVMDGENKVYKFPLGSVYDLDETRFNIVFNTLDKESNVWNSEDLILVKDSSEVENLKTRLRGSQYVLIVWGDARPLINMRETAEKARLDNELIDVSPVSFSVVE